MNRSASTHGSARTRPRPAEASRLAWRTAAVLLAALLSPACAHSTPVGDSPAGSIERHALSGARVAVYNLAGAMVLEPAAGAETIVEVTRAGADAGRLRLTTGHADGRQDLRVIYPGDRIVYPVLSHGSSSTTRVRDDGTFGGEHAGTWPDGRRVRIAGSGSGIEAHADVRVRVAKNADVLVRLAVGDVRVMNVDSKLFIDLGNGAVVTSDTRGDLDIDTGSGSVRVARATGSVTIDTGSGGVSVHDVRGGPLSIDTGSGGVEASVLDVPKLSVDTGSGRVELGEVIAASVHIDTGSGGVAVGLLKAIDELDVDTGSGGVEVRMPRDAGAMLALEAGSGSLDVDLPMTSVHRDQGELRGQVGDGRGRIVIETGSGGIRVAGN